MDSTDCPSCGHHTPLLHSQETVLTVSLLIALILFLITGAVARGYHEKLHALAGQWFQTAQNNLNAGKAAEALADLRNALVYEPADPRIQFRLAQALIADGSEDEARSYLAGLLARSPSDAEVNLELARIAAKSGNERDALRYYHGAIYGVWPDHPRQNRLNTRLELCRFLLAGNDEASADGELIALQSDLPEKNATPLHEQTAELFLKAGDAPRALAEFRAVLNSPHPPAAAWKGAGMAAFTLGYFSAAEHYLQVATRFHQSDPEIAEELQSSRLIQQWDPYLRGLTAAEKRARTRHDFSAALARLETCAKSSGVQLPAPSRPAKGKTKILGNAITPAVSGSAADSANSLDLVALYQRAGILQPQLAERNLKGHPETIDAVMNLVFAIESATAQKCGPPAGLDAALLLLRKTMQNGER